MKLNGTQKFTVPSTQVFHAILDTEVLKASIPGATAVSYAIPHEKLQIELSLPFPGLHGPFTVSIDVASQQATNSIEFHVARQGKGGKADATCQVSLADEAGGSLLTYNTTAKLEGLIAVADNPLGQGLVKSKLAEFFKNFEKEVAKARV